MKKLIHSILLLALVGLNACFMQPVDMAIIAVMENDNQKVQKMPTDQQMAFQATNVAVIPSSSRSHRSLQGELADVLRQTVSRLPGVEVVNTEQEAHWVLRPEITNTKKEVKTEFVAGDPTWRVTGRIEGEVLDENRKTGEVSKIRLNYSDSQTVYPSAGSRQRPHQVIASVYPKLLSQAVRNTARRQSSALKRKFPMAMYIIETKGARKYVRLNRGRAH